MPSLTLKKYENNEYVIWLLILFIVLTFLMSLTNIIFKAIFILILTILVYFGYFYAFKKASERISDDKLRNVSFINKIKFKMDLFFSFWIIGIFLFGYSFLLLLFYDGFFNDILQTHTDFIIILCQIGLAVSVLLTSAGGFGSMVYKKKGFKYLYALGFLLIASIISVYSFTFLTEYPLIMEFLFYLFCLLGVFFLLVEEVYFKNKLSATILLIIVSILSIIFLLDYMGIIEFYFYREMEFKIITTSDLIGLIEEIIFISLIISILYYVFNYKDMKGKKEQKKEHLEDLIQLLLIGWVVSVGFYVVSIL